MGARALAAAAAAAIAMACAGPDPRIERVDIVAPRLPGMVRVALVVLNRSAGHGDVQIKVHLRTRDGAHVLAAERSLELEGHQRLEMSVDIPAPEADYVAEAHGVYPD
jgi:hypothetical protein